MVDSIPPVSSHPNLGYCQAHGYATALVVSCLALALLATLNHFQVLNFFSKNVSFYCMIVPSTIIVLVALYKACERLPLKNKPTPTTHAPVPAKKKEKPAAKKTVSNVKRLALKPNEIPSFGAIHKTLSPLVAAAVSAPLEEAVKEKTACATAIGPVQLQVSMSDGERVIPSVLEPTISSSLTKGYLLDNQDDFFKLLLSVGCKTVKMNQYEVVRCHESTPVFLGTYGLGPCIGVTAICKLKDGSKLIGVAHLSQTDYRMHGMGIQLEYRVRFDGHPFSVAEQLPHFDPFLLNNLIDAIKQSPNYNQEEIHFTLSGGQGRKGVVEYFELLKAYIQSLPNVQLVGTFFDPYQMNDEVEVVLRNTELSTHVGITPKGQILLAKASVTFGHDLTKARAYRSSLVK